MSELECPYCDHSFEHVLDNSDYDQDRLHECQCPKCEKYFVFNTFILYHHETFKADCLNGSEHDWKLAKTYPREFSNMKCKTCDKERKLTNDERIKYKIDEK